MLGGATAVHALHAERAGWPRGRRSVSGGLSRGRAEPGTGVCVAETDAEIANRWHFSAFTFSRFSISGPVPFKMDPEPFVSALGTISTHKGL